MISPKSLPITALLLGATVNAQVYETGGRSADAFSWVQPEDTIILDQYNSSEPVYPSRRSIISLPDQSHALTFLQPESRMMQMAGKTAWRRLVRLSRNSLPKRRQTWSQVNPVPVSAISTQFLA